MGTISACRSRGNKNARVARALARYARRTGPPFSLNILRSILRTFGGTVSPFFYERSLYISYERHESGCHDNKREKEVRAALRDSEKPSVSWSFKNLWNVR